MANNSSITMKIRFGMTSKEAQSHFTGPAFLPWNRMGNLNRWAGPLPLAWMERERVLQKRILRRVRSVKAEI